METKQILNFFTKYLKKYEISYNGNPIAFQCKNDTNVDKKLILFGGNI